MTELRTYMAYLTLYENNFRVLHWKLAGAGFHTAHTRFGDYYHHLGDLLDETAEQAITIGVTPVSSKETISLLDEVDTTALVINPALDISEHTANVAASNMFEQLRTMAADLAGNTEFPAEVADVFMDHSKYFRIEGTYKLSRAIMTPSEAE